MTTRKLTKAEEVELLKVELKNRQESLERLMKKLETVGWTKSDKELADEHTKFIKQNARIVKEFYRPAIIF